MRRNMGWGGIPFITVWKQKRIEKPRVMVLCDVSGSVSAMSQFLLMFLYALNEALKDIRSFAFAGSLIEVSDILAKEPVEQAITKIMEMIGYGSSNYGNSFADFQDQFMDKVTNKTTVLILGGLLLPFLRGPLRAAALLFVPLITLYLVWQVSDGIAL